MSQTPSSAVTITYRGTIWPASLGAGKWVAWPLAFILPPLVGVLAWHLGSDHLLWKVGAAGWAVVLAGCFLALPERHARSTGRTWMLLAFPGLLGALWLGVGLAGTRTPVYVENFSGQEVYLELDGGAWLTVPHGVTLQTRLLPGDHRLVTRSRANGAELDRRTITVAGPGPYLLNVLGAQTYYRGSVDYGVGVVGSENPAREEAIRDVWIRADVDYLFTQAPKTIAVPPDQEFATRTYLARSPRPR